jgi:hypothetical protein
MRRLSLVATAVGALALTASAMAQNPPAQQPGRQGAPPPAAPAQKPPSEMTASGTVVKYDPVTRMLTLTMTQNRQETFELGPKVTIQEGAKTLTVADLGSATGKEATVRYADSGGKKIATSVMLVAKPAGSTTQKPAPGNPPATQPPPAQPRPR